jgi:hypothetical protein
LHTHPAIHRFCLIPLYSGASDVVAVSDDVLVDVLYWLKYKFIDFTGKWLSSTRMDDSKQALSGSVRWRVFSTQDNGQKSLLVCEMVNFYFQVAAPNRSPCIF